MADKNALETVTGRKITYFKQIFFVIGTLIS